VINASEDYREKTVREFLDMIQDPVTREDLRSGITESLKMNGYTEDQIHQMKVKDMWDKLKDVLYQLGWLNIIELEKALKRLEDKSRGARAL
jgi:hypothetical protein